LLHEIKRRKVVLASVLKPVDDTRMLEKLGASLEACGEYEVFIIGYPSSGTINHPNINLLPLPEFGRKSLKRLIIPWTVFRKINQVKPDTIIINTPELLLVAVINKIFYRRKLVYDILENYYRNISNTSTYPPVLKNVLAFVTRLTEMTLAPFVDQFLLAEKGYLNELRFFKPVAVLENKLPKSMAQQQKIERKPYFHLLFTGTLGQTTGVFEAIRLAKELHNVNPAYTLTLIGSCALPEVLKEIKAQVNDFPFITLKGGDKLVPHAEILNEISQAGTGIIIYPHNSTTESSIPTKLYEYLALRLPILISHTGPSTRLVEEYHAGLVLDEPVNYPALHERLAASAFAFNTPESIYWDEDGEKLVALLKN
jgi:glycosyltransferase involved in cell wall biosynthesis